MEIMNEPRFFFYFLLLIFKKRSGYDLQPSLANLPTKDTLNRTFKRTKRSVNRVVATMNKQTHRFRLYVLGDEHSGKKYIENLYMQVLF